jgi:ATP-binding cassette subfamily B protein
MKGRTSFVIAHRIQSVMNADQIVVLDKGRIVQKGAHEQLMEQTGPYRQIFDLQTRIEDELEQEIASAALMGEGRRMIDEAELYPASAVLQP